MFIADAQIHIWSANTPERPWLPGAYPNFKVPLGADEVLNRMNAAGVHRAVLVPPFLDGNRADLVLAAARAHPDRFAAMGRVDLATPASRKLLKTWRQQPGMLGMRFSFHRPQLAPMITEGRIDWLWEEAEKSGIPVMVNVTPAMVSVMDQVAGRYPELKLALDHLALPLEKTDEDAFRDFDKLLAIAKRPNVVTKITALPCYTADTYPYRKLHPYVRRVYDAFGPRRLFWGSDLSRLRGSYQQCVTMFTEEMPWFTGDDLQWIMGRGLCEWLDWKLPAAPTGG